MKQTRPETLPSHHSHTPRASPSHAAVVAARMRIRPQSRVSILNTLYVGELARLATMAQYGSLYGGAVSPVLSGRSTAGRVAGHRHAFYLPTDEDGDGVLDHLTVYAVGGLDYREQSALLRVRSLWHGTLNGSRLSMQASGDRIELAFERFLLASDLRAWPRMFGPAKTWRSSTPFVLIRYPKQYRDGRAKLNEAGRQKDGPEDQLLDEWERRRVDDPTLPSICRMERLDYLTLLDGQLLSWTAFCRRRAQGGGTSSDFAFGLEIEFDEPVRQRPIALGYACHFGLGQFASVGT